MRRSLAMAVGAVVAAVACGRSMLDAGDGAALDDAAPASASTTADAAGRNGGATPGHAGSSPPPAPAGGMRGPAVVPRERPARPFEPRGPSAGDADAGGVDEQPPPPLSPFQTTGDCLPGFIRASVESLSYDGRYFAFVDADESATVLDRQSGDHRHPTLPTGESLDVVAISGVGMHVAFKGLPGNQSTLFVWSAETDESWRQYFLGDGTQGALSYIGQHLTFSSRDPAITVPPPHAQGGIVVTDIVLQQTWLASVGPDGEAANDYSALPDLSDDGNLVVFASTATNLVAGKPGRRWDVYLHDHGAGRTLLLAPSLGGGYANAYTQRVRISGDGTTVAFDSPASDLVIGDTADTPDLFVRELPDGGVRSPTMGRTRAATLALANLSHDGRVVLFTTDGDGLVAEDDNARGDVYAYDRARDHFELVSRSRDGALLGAESTAVALSGDGRVAAFTTRAAELTDGVTEVTCFAEREP